MKKYFVPALFSIAFVILLMSLSPTIPTQNLNQALTPTLTAVVPTQAVETPLQTYRNEKYGFEFEYPTELNISESQNQDNLFVYYGPVQKYENLCQTTNLTISINGNEACGSLADKGVIPKIVESKFVWANQSTTLYDDYLDNKPIESRIDPIRNNKNKISASFIITPDNYNNLINIRESFFKILSTFKFTESKFCGGIAGVACPTGLKCILDGQYPDAGGKCQ